MVGRGLTTWRFGQRITPHDNRKAPKQIKLISTQKEVFSGTHLVTSARNHGPNKNTAIGKPRFTLIAPSYPH